MVLAEVEEVKIAKKKYMKKCSTSLAITKCKSKPP
jgi:hypothetical protein